MTDTIYVYAQGGNSYPQYWSRSKEDVIKRAMESCYPQYQVSLRNEHWVEYTFNIVEWMEGDSWSDGPTERYRVKMDGWKPIGEPELRD